MKTWKWNTIYETEDHQHHLLVPERTRLTFDIYLRVVQQILNKSNKWSLRL